MVDHDWTLFLLRPLMQLWSFWPHQNQEHSETHFLHIILWHSWASQVRVRRKTANRSPLELCSAGRMVLYSSSVRSFTAYSQITWPGLSWPGLSLQQVLEAPGLPQVGHRWWLKSVQQACGPQTPLRALTQGWQRKTVNIKKQTRLEVQQYPFCYEEDGRSVLRRQSPSRICVNRVQRPRPPQFWHFQNLKIYF